MLLIGYLPPHNNYPTRAHGIIIVKYCWYVFSLVAAAYSYFNLGESSSSSDDEDYSPEDWKKVLCWFLLVS